MQWTEYLGHPAAKWIGAAGSIIAVWIAIRASARWLRRRVAGRTRRDHDAAELLTEVLARTRVLLPIGMGLLVFTRWIEITPRVLALLLGAAAIALGVQAGFYLGAALDFFLAREAAKRAHQRDALTSFAVMKAIGHVVVWTVVATTVLANLGVNVTGLVASLGVGGIAVALAAQKILGDLFASMSIVLDRPFEVGDFIVVGDFMGTVEQIGVKTTRVRGLGGEQQVFANADLLESRIRNYQRLAERRVVFSFGLCYGASSEQLRQVPELVRRAVEAESKVRFDRCHFHRFGESSLDFEVVYYVLSPDYNAFMDRQQAIHLAIYDGVKALGLDFAFPTRTLHVGSQVLSRDG